MAIFTILGAAFAAAIGAGTFVASPNVGGFVLYFDSSHKVRA